MFNAPCPTATLCVSDMRFAPNETEGSPALHSQQDPEVCAHAWVTVKPEGRDVTGFWG